MLVPVPHPRPATLFGPGKLDELKAALAADDIELAVVDHPLTPIQQRNLERHWKVKVLDRTGLILEIFGDRARTREGRLQVELAHLTYQKSRLVRSWTHLERQRGGFGFLGGPGETQIEADRRMIQERIEAISRELRSVKRTRSLHRRGRARVPYPVLALVGYTNAGKSTLFNRLTGGDVVARDQLFATLDPTMRALELASGRSVILSDTVGFISELPTGLIAAFRATLEEVVEADLIVHVRDIAHGDSEAQRIDVENVLDELGIFAGAGDQRIIEVWNKIDHVTPERRLVLAGMAKNAPATRHLVSATTGEGLDDLRAAIDQHFRSGEVEMQLVLPPAAGALLHWVHENAEVVQHRTDDDGCAHLTIRIGTSRRAKLLRHVGGCAGASAKPGAG